MPDLDPRESVAASELVSSALIASLIPALVEAEVLSGAQARKVYENALLLLTDGGQGESPAVQRIYEAAWEVIEAHLRPEQ